jgi:hypothetical protein
MKLTPGEAMGSRSIKTEVLSISLQFFLEVNSLKTTGSLISSDGRNI